MLQTSEFDINISKQYTILLNKLDFQNLPLPHQVTIDRLPTNYFEQSIESIDNFKEKFNQSSNNLKEIVEMLQQIQLQKDPSFNFEGFEEEISKIYL